MNSDWNTPQPDDIAPTVLVVASEGTHRDELLAELEPLDADVHLADNPADTLTRLHETPVDVCIVRGSGTDDLDRTIRSVWSRIPLATSLLRVLANPERPGIDVIAAPWTAGRLKRRVLDLTRYSRLVRENEGLRNRLLRRVEWIAQSQHQVVSEVRDGLARVASTRDDVVLQGGTGSLLEPWARLIHELGPRSNALFVRLDGRTLTVDDFDAAHAPGGRIHAAEGGIVFLDHAECTADAVRERLRRRNPHLRIAGTTDLPTQFVLGIRDDSAATLAAECGSTPSFRVPLLCERPDDVAAIAGSLMHGIAERLGEIPKTLADDAVELLRRHDWPGNEEELTAVLENAFSTESGPVIGAAAVGSWIGVATFGDATIGTPLRVMEQRLIEATFARCDGNRERTAKSLGIGIRTLSGKLREYGYPPRGGPGSNRRNRRDAA